MSDPNERVIRRETGLRLSATGQPLDEITIRLHTEKLPAIQEEARRGERKYNMRIKSQDLALLDAIADHVGRPRSQLINELLHGILLKELQALGSLDAQVLVAVAADKDAAYDPLGGSWTSEVLRREINELVENLLWHTYEQPIDFPRGMSPEEEAEIKASRNSEAFHNLSAMIQGLRR